MFSIEDVPLIDMIHEVDSLGRDTIPEHSSLALDFFKLDRYPFSDNVNPQFFYRTESHENAFIAMKRCIEDDISLGLTTAISGTGKTLLTQVLLQDLPPQQYKVALVLIYPKMSPSALLREICNELEIEVPQKRPSTHTMINQIQQKIMGLYVQGTKLVLIIDEVHFLDAQNLQVLRTLSNIETPERKLVTILLFGEEGFLKKLENPTFKSILSRMYTRVKLTPLNCEEVEQYVKYRLLLANGKPHYFEPDCFPWLAEESGGIPREINRLCHMGLQAAAMRGQHMVTKELLEIVKTEQPQL